MKKVPRPHLPSFDTFLRSVRTRKGRGGGGGGGPAGVVCNVWRSANCCSVYILPHVLLHSCRIRVSERMFILTRYGATSRAPFRLLTKGVSKRYAQWCLWDVHLHAIDQVVRGFPCASSERGGIPLKNKDRTNGWVARKNPSTNRRSDDVFIPFERQTRENTHTHTSIFDPPLGGSIRVAYND